MKNNKIMFGANCIRKTRIPYSAIDSLIQEHYPTLTLNLIIESIREDGCDVKYNNILWDSTLFGDWANDTVWDGLL